MFKTYVRIKEKQIDGKTVYVIQERYFLFWWNMSDPIEDKEIAESLKILLEYRSNKPKKN